MSGYPPIFSEVTSEDINKLTSLIQMSVTHPNPDTLAQATVVGTANADLPPPTGFVGLLNMYSPVVPAEGNVFVAEPDGRVRVKIAAYINIVAYADIKHSVNNSTVGAAFAIQRGGSTIYSARSVHAKMPNAGDIGHLSGNGLVLTQPEDIIGIGIASNLSGTIKIRASTIVYSVRRLV
jgi:hypothetical protein